MRLTRFEHRSAVASMEAIFPGSREMGLLDIRTMNVDGFLRELMVELPFRAALGVRLAVWLVAFAPLFVVFRLATIARLAIDERERVIAALVTSESYAIRSLVLILKTLGALLYAGDERVRMRVRPPALAVLKLRVTRAHAT